MSLYWARTSSAFRSARYAAQSSASFPASKASGEPTSRAISARDLPARSDRGAESLYIHQNNQRNQLSLAVVLPWYLHTVPSFSVNGGTRSRTSLPQFRW